jgi:hypothetical protein
LVNVAPVRAFSVQAFFIEQLAFTFEVEGLDESSEVRFDIASPVSKVVEGARVARLTITQAGFQKDSKMYAGCKRAWPEILSSVKTYVETGRPLGFA